MNTTLSLTNEHTHPPIGLTVRGLLDRGILHLGLGLVRWAQRSELLRNQRRAHQLERAARHHELQSMRRELELQRARLDTHVLYRSLH